MNVIQNDDKSPSLPKRPEQNRRKNYAGGSAAAGGMNLQARVSAVAAAHVLARFRLGWLRGKVVDVPVEISAETNGPGDDIRLRLEEGSVVEVQVKKGLSRGADLWSALISLAQGVHSKTVDYGLLIIDIGASGSIRGPLALGIERIGQGRFDSLDEIAQDFLRRLAIEGIPPQAACSKLRIVIVHCANNDDASEHAAKTLLREFCAFESQADGAWRAIENAAHGLIEQRGKWERNDALQLLTDSGIEFDPAEISPSTAPVGCVWERMQLFPSSHGHIQRFRQAYLVSEQLGNRAFGGREAECDQLDAWLADSLAPSRYLLCAPTARGKSALLVRWTEQFTSETIWAVVFAPISLRFGTERPSVFYELIATQMATIMGVPLVVPPTDLESYYRSMSGLLLKQAADAGRHVLLVVDGIDEAGTPGFDPSIIPRSLNANVRIVVSARQQAGDRGAEGWLERMEWQRNVRVVAGGLAALGPGSLASILQSVHIEEGEITKELIERLMTLSLGEPLLVALYAEDLAHGKLAGRNVSVDALVELLPGYAPYFSRAFDARNLPLGAPSQKLIDATLVVLAMALGPIEGADLTSLVCVITKEPRPFSKDFLIEPLKRYIAGDGSREYGYVFNHPKLGEYLREQKFDSQVQQAVEAAIIDWGRTALLELERGDIRFLPAYLQRHLLEHFRRCGGLNQNDADSFLRDGWRQCWFASEKDYAGYADSLISLAALLPPCTEEKNIAEAIKLRMKIAVLVGSVKSQGINMPADLVALAVQENLLTIQQALNVVGLQLPSNRPSYLLAIGKYLSPGQLEELSSEIFRTEDTVVRNEQLARLSDLLAEPLRTIVADHVLKWLNEDGEIQPRCGVFAALTPVLSREQTESFFEKFRSLALGHKNPLAAMVTLAQSLGRLRERRLAVLEESVVNSCLQLIETEGDAFLVAEALKAVALYLPPTQLQLQISRAHALLDGEVQEFAGAPLNSKAFHSEIRRERIKQTWATLTTLECNALPTEIYTHDLLERLKPLFVPDYWSCQALLNVLPIVRTEARRAFADQLHIVTLALPSANNRTHALRQLAALSDGAARQTMLIEALVNARCIEDAYTIAMTLLSLFKELSSDEKEAAYKAMVADIRKIPYAVHLGQILMEASALLPAAAELRDEGLQLLMVTEGIGNNVATVLCNIRSFPVEERQAIFENCWQRIRQSETFWTLHQYGSAAHYAGEFWTEAHLDSVMLAVEQADGNYHIHSISQLLPVACRLGRKDAVERICNLIAEDKNLTERVALLRHVIDSTLVSDRWREMWRTAWFDALRSGQQALRTLIDTFDALEASDQIVAWPKLVEMSNAGTGSADALLRLSQIAKSKHEKIQLFTAALAASSSVQLDQRFWITTQLISAAPDASFRMLAINSLIPNSEVSRDAALSAIRTLAPAIAESGGTTAVRRIMADVRLSVAWWQ